MSEETDIVEMAPAALSDREWTLISRLNQICVMMARATTREKVLEKIAEEFADVPADAERWLCKAEEYMASGAIESMDVSRSMYHMRLSEIYSLAMAHAVKDQVEFTTKPTKMIIVTENGETEERIINAQHTKVRPNALDTGALQVALKAAREAAHIMGLRPNKARRGVAIGVVNLQINNPGGQASRTMDLTTELLAGMVGATVVEAEVTDAESPGPEIFPDASEESDPAADADESRHSGGETDDGE